MGDLFTAFWYLKGLTRKMEQAFIVEPIMTGEGVMVLK